MIYTTYPVNIDFRTSKDSLYFLDIETTGLCKLNDTIIAIGLIQYTNNSLIFHQWLLEKKDEESSILTALFALFQQSARIYAYNGKRFDFQFIKTKTEIYDIQISPSWQWIDYKDLPTFKYLTKHHFTKRNLLESLVNYKRTLTTTGKALAKISRLNLEHPSSIYQETILGHNKEETLSLIFFYQLHQFLTNISVKNLETISSSDPASDTVLSFTFKCIYPLNFSVTLNLGVYQLNYTGTSSYVTLSIRLFKGELTHYLNPKDYFIVEGNLLHTSLSTFIPSSQKIRPKKDQCFLKQSGYFLPCSPDTTDRIWRDEHQNSYLEITPNCDLENVIATFIKKINLSY